MSIYSERTNLEELSLCQNKEKVMASKKSVELICKISSTPIMFQMYIANEIASPCNMLKQTRLTVIPI